MEGIAALRIIPFTTERIPNPYPKGKLPWQVYHSVRNDIVRTCRQFGPTGPMGEMPVDADVEDPYGSRLWERGDDDAVYFIVDDQCNDERYLYAELYGDDPFHVGWLAAIIGALKKHSGWGIGVSNIPDSYVLIFSDRLMVKGTKLARCQTSAQVVECVRSLLKRGGKKWWQFWK